MTGSEPTPGTVLRVKLFPIYKVLALVVGVLLIVGTLVSLAKYTLPEGSDLQQLGVQLSIVWMFHGFIYMVYVVVAFLLSVRAGWKLSFLGLLLLAGLVPVLIFFVERKVEARLRAENPELVSS
jgi:integral membrane protein